MAVIIRKKIYEEQINLGNLNNKELSKKCDIMTRSAGTNFLKVSKTWDSGNRRTRECMLREFIKTHQNSTGSQLELDLVNGASLLLTRITTWLRLSYLLLDCNISLQLDAISIFLAANSGTHFLHEFIEVGGMDIVLEIMNMNAIDMATKISALKLLFYFVNAGRKYKEFLCKFKGIESLIECLITAKSEEVVNILKEIFFELTQGNPKYVAQIFSCSVYVFSPTSSTASSIIRHCAAQIIKAVIPQMKYINIENVDSIIVTLKSINQEAQFECYELMKDLLKRQELHEMIINYLLQVVNTVLDYEFDEKKNQGGNILLNSQYSQQAYAAKLLGIMAVKYNHLATAMIENQVIYGLLNIISNTNHAASQQAASETLLFLSETYKEVNDQLIDHLGNSFYQEFTNNPGIFYKTLTVSQKGTLRKQNLNDKSLISKENKFDVISGDDSNELTHANIPVPASNTRRSSINVLKNDERSMVESDVKISITKEVDKIQIPFAVSENLKSFSKQIFKSAETTKSLVVASGISQDLKNFEATEKNDVELKTELVNQLKAINAPPKRK